MQGKFDVNTTGKTPHLHYTGLYLAELWSQKKARTPNLARTKPYIDY